MKKGSIKYLQAMFLALVTCAFATTSVAVEVSTVDELTTALASATDGTVIELADGTYELSAKVTLSSGVIIRSASGRPEDVIIKPSVKCRPFDMKHAGAELSGLTIEGWNAGAGAGSEDGGGVIAFPSNGGGGTVTNCVIRNGNCTDHNYNAQGGGICMKGPGLVTHCVITNNAIPHTATYQNGINDGGGMGVYIDNDGAIVRNCLIAGNTSLRKPDGTAVTGLQEGIMGALRINAGLLESCTIAGNESLWCSGVYATGGIVRNCLIGNNTTTKGSKAYSVYAGNGSCFDYCAAPVTIEGASNCLVVPTPFVSFERGDYRPIPGTASIDGGYYDAADEGVAWMATAKDLPRANDAANGRIINNVPDIGAYELNDSERSEFVVNLYADKTAGFAPFTATFTAVVANAGENAVYKWYIDGKAVANETGPVFVYHLDSVNTVTINKISIVVEKSDGTSSEISPTPISVTVYPTTLHASPGKDTLQPLVASAISDNEIVLASGIYEITTGMTIDKKLTIRSESGRPEDVIIKATKSVRPFKINHADALLSGLTIEGYSSGIGGSTDNGSGGGVIYFPSKGNGGTVTNCVIRKGQVNANYLSYGGGVSMFGPGLVTHCVITNNSVPFYTTTNEGVAGGSGVYLNNENAIVRNCLIAYNSTVKTVSGTTLSGKASEGLMGAVIIKNGRLESCTIAGNEGRQCAGVRAEGGKIVNCLIGGNISQNGTEDYYSVYAGTGSCFDHCVAPIAISGGTDCSVAKEPFTDFDSGDLRPMPGTASVDGGYYDAADKDVQWMATGKDLPFGPDRSVNDRIIDGMPDVGAYELTADMKVLFLVSVEADTSAAFAPFTVSFTSHLENVGENPTYQWYVNDEAVTAATGPNFEYSFDSSITAATTIRVHLVVTKTTGLNASAESSVVEVTAHPKCIYPEPGTDTLRAALETAIKGMEIILADGEYIQTSETVLDKGVTIRSASGDPSRVVIKPADGKSVRIFTINSADAVIADVTVEGTKHSGHGGGVILFPEGGLGGTVTNCVIRGGTLIGANYRMYGGGICFLGRGLATHCIITNNAALYNQPNATANMDYCGGSGIYLGNSDATVRNCLIAYNSTLRQSDGTIPEKLCGKTMGAVIVEKGLLANCTIAMNEGGECAGINAKNAEGIVTNCLIAANTSTNVVANAAWPVYAGNASSFKVCGAPIEIEGGKNCIEIEENPFRNLENGDFRLLSSSKAVNVTRTTVDKLGFRCDLLGKKRIVNGKLDLGCYECQVETGFRLILR